MRIFRFFIPGLALLWPVGAAAQATGPVVVAGSGSGSSLVRALSATDGSELGSGFPFGPAFTGGVRVASGDVNGDGTPDVIVGSGPGGSQIRVVDGRDFSLRASFFAFAPSFTGGVYVAAGDVNGDGNDDVIVGGGPGSGLLRVFNGLTNAEIAVGAPFTPAYSGGVTVAAGDINGDGRTDVVAAMATGGLVAVYSGVDSAPLGAGFPYGPLFFGGVNVATGDVNGDGRIDIITGSRTGAGSVRAFSGHDLSVLGSFTPYSGSNGVSVAAGDVDGDGRADIITGPGSGVAPRVRVFSAASSSEIASYFAFDPAFTGGVFVAFAGGPLRFTSSNAATFRTGSAGTVTIKTSAGAGTTITTSSALPSGITLADNGNGTATLSGTAAAGTGGVHTLALVATRGSSSATQSFTLTVEQAPAFTSASLATFTEGSADTFGITATGYPAPAITLGGSLPAGLSFAGGDGTATISGTPASAGSVVVPLSASNVAGSTTQSVTISVAPRTINQAPSFTKGPDQTVAEDAGSVSVPGWATNIDAGGGESQVVTFDVTSNSNPALFSSGPAVNGTTGALTFTTAPNANGTATIAIAAHDNGGTANGGVDMSPSQTFVINVTAVNDAPVASNNTFAVAEGGTLTITAPGVLAGDTDVEGNPLTAVLVGGPANATAFTLNADGSFTYTHNGSETPDSFTYRANDGTLDSNVATVTITINGVNDAPVANNDTGFTVGEGGTLTPAAPGVLANDSDAENNALTAVLVSGPANASSFTLNGDGSFSYTHNGSETTTDSFTYKAVDGLLDSNAATVTITITAVNDAPVAVADAYSVNEGGTLPVPTPGVLGNDTEAEGNPLTAVLVSGPANAAVFALNADGSFSYTHNGSEASTDSFTYRANDGSADSNIVTVTITINPVNDAPIATNDAFSVAEGGTLSPLAPGVLSNDTDAEGTPLTAAIVTLPANGTLTLNPNGSFTYTHNGSETTTDSFTYRASDGTANSNTATVTITITPVNDGPAIDLDANDSGGAAGTDYAPSFAINGPAIFIEDAADATLTDVDSTTLSSLTVTLTNLLDPTFEVLDVDLTGANPAFTKNYDTTADPTKGVLTITASPAQPVADFVTLLRKVTYQNTDATPDSSTARVITFVANDGTANSNTATSTVTLVTNSPPTATNDAYSVAEGGTLNQAAPGVLGNDTDPDTNPLTAVLASGPSNGTLTLNPDGSFTYTHNGSETTTDSFTYRANDGFTDSTIATVTITITAVNDAPVAVADSYSVNEGGTLNASSVLANDTDAENNPLTAVLVSGPAQASSFSLSANGTFTYTHNGSETTSDSFTYRANDGTANGNVATVTITINPVNDVPVAVADAHSVNEGATLNVPAPGVLGNDTDAEGNTLTAAQVTGPVNGALTLNADGSFTYVHNGSETTTDSFTYRANDGTANSNTATVTITINPVNDAPVVTTSAGTTSFVENLPAVVVDGAITVADPDNTNLASATVTLAATPDGAAEALANAPASCVGLTVGGSGSATLTITGNQPIATYQACLRSITYNNTSNTPAATVRTVNFSVNDGAAGSNIASKSVSVTPTNDAPTVVNETFDIVGNTELRVDMTTGTTPHTSETTAGATAFEGVLDNDSDVEGNPFTVTAISNCTVADTAAPFDCTLTGGAVVHVDANGEFSYTPAAGATTGSFTYTVTDTPIVGSPASATGTVTFNFSSRVWYVDADFVGTPNGTSVAPFTNFTSLSGAGGAGDSDSPGDYIFVHASTVTSTLELEANQHLLGEGVGLSIPVDLNANGSPTNIVAAGTAPTVSAGADVIRITQAMPAEVRGLTLTTSVGNAIDVTSTGALSGSATLTISNNTFAGAAAETIDVNAGATGTLALTIGPNTWTGTHTNNGIDVRTTAGTLNLAITNNGSIATTSGTAILVDGSGGGSLNITDFSGITVPGSHGGTGVSVNTARFDQTPGGGYQTVNGGALSIGASGNGVSTAGMVFTNVSGDVSFTDLDIFADNGAALSIDGVNTPGVGVNTGSATGTQVVVAGTPTLVSAGGPVVNISDTTVTMPITSATVTSSPTTGISLSNVVDGTTTATFSVTSGAISGTTGNAFSVTGSNATVSYGGTIASTTTTARSVNVTGNGGNDTISFTGAVSGTGNSGILLDNNDQLSGVSTITFSGGITLNGASSTFTATNGGTVNVTGTNTIGATTVATGPALNVAGTTIGASGMTFRTISATGGTNGIVLNATGATGGLTVTGNSAGNCGGTITQNPVGTPSTVGAPVTTDCTGGVIQNTTAAGIALTDTRNTSLTRMHVLNSGTDGLLVSNINGFTLANSFVTDSSGAAQDRGIEMGDFSTGTGVNGTITISNSTLGPTPHDNFGIGIGSGTSSWNITNTVFTGSSQNSGLNFEFRNAAAVTSFAITGSVFQNQFADGMQMQPAGGTTGSMTATIQNTTFSGNNLHLDLNHDGVANVTYNVLNNTFRTAQSHAFNFFSSAVQAPGTGGTLTATISGNVIGTVGTASSGSVLGNGLRININGGVDATVLVTNNTIRQTPNGRGIEVISRNGTGGLDITLTSNNVDNNFFTTPQNGGFSLASIFVQSNCVTVCNTLRSDIRLNTVPAAAPDGELLAAQLALIETSASTLQLLDTGAASASCTAQLTENNTGSAAANAGCSLITGSINTP